MDLMQAILTRRSVRTFRDEPVPAETLEACLRAAMHAPSAGDAREWRFVVVDERPLLTEITRIHPYARALESAPLGIVVCGDEDAQRYPGYWPQDCAAATLNLLLAAHDAGLGAVWCGIHPLEEREQGMRKLLGLPRSVRPFCVVALGWPDGERPAADEDRYEPDYVFRNRYP
jgi:nitroreductase